MARGVISGSANSSFTRKLSGICAQRHDLTVVRQLLQEHHALPHWVLVLLPELVLWSSSVRIMDLHLLQRMHCPFLYGRNS